MVKDYISRVALSVHADLVLHAVCLALCESWCECGCNGGCMLLVKEARTADLPELHASVLIRCQC